LRVRTAAVELVRVDLHPPANCVAEYRRLLSPEECVRADRFVTADLTRRFVVCRAVLRLCLAERLGKSPAEIAFVTGPHGKPALADEDSCQFNVSHSADLALIAVSDGRTLGVDVETVTERVSRDELAGRFFSPDERAAYFALPEALRLQAFFRIWTCKEAFLKATGLGLSFPLGRFSVSVAPDEPPGLLHVRDDPDAPRRWAFAMPVVSPTFAAALAVDGHDWTLQTRDWVHG
jgi:4'-phosphopantetheinyl transferase